MTIEKIKMFLAICLYGTVSKAGESLFISQPAVSQGIRDLEKELGVSLFHREGRSLVLSQAGKEFLPLATKLADVYEETASLFKTEKPKELSIGCTVTTATYMLPKLIARYEKEHSVKLRIIVDNVVAITKLLEENKIDLGFIEGLPTKQDFLYYPLNLFELVFVAGKDYLAQERGSFSDHDFLVREKGSSYRILFDNYYLLQQGATVEPKWVSFSNDVLKQAALHNQGVALLPQIAVAEELKTGDLVSLPFGLEPPKEHNGLIVNKYRASEKRLSDFIQFAKKYI